MSHTHLPIFGAGSQPADSDGAQLDYMRMPNEMSTYSAPLIPEPEDVTNLDDGMAKLETLLTQLRNYEGQPTPAIDLKGLDAANLSLINQVLGEGDVSIAVENTPRTLVQESVLAGVWRVQSQDKSGHLLSDHVEVGTIPRVVREACFANAKSEVHLDTNTLPEGVMNAPPLLTEINDQIPKVQQQNGSHTINLSLLPQTEQDLLFLQQHLGAGKVIILSRGYGNCRITSTNTQNIWWVQYFNSQDTAILNTLEITEVPEVACAAAEDIDDSAQRLNEILEIYR